MTCQFKNCPRRVIENSNYCHLLSHHPDSKTYFQIQNALKSKFELSTLDLDNFTIYDVKADGACLYRCMVLALFGTELDESQETYMASNLQNIIRKWIMKNRNRTVPEFQMTVENLVLSCHEFASLEEYDYCYQIFAGDQWGGIAEIYVFSKIFNLHISVYFLQRFDPKFCKIVRANLNGIKGRLKLIQKFNISAKKTANFLLTKKDMNHYMFLKN